MPLFFEDLAPGQVVELGSRTVTEAEILEFARHSIRSRSTSILRRRGARSTEA